MASYLNAIACPASSTCFAVGFAGVVVATTDSGSTWSVQETNNYGPGFWGVSCTSTSACEAVGEFGSLAFTSDGIHWQRQDSGFESNLTGISCPSSMVCYVVSSLADFNQVVLTTNDGGASWKAVTTPGPGQPVLQSISCPNTTECVVVGSLIAATWNGGTSWTVQTSGTTSPLTGVTCPTTDACVAVTDHGGVLSTTNLTAGVWVAHQSGAGELNAISCPTASYCYAVGGSVSPPSGYIVASADGGTTWKTVKLGSIELKGMSCPSWGSCVAVGDDIANPAEILVTEDAGLNWTTQNPGNYTLTTVACPSTNVCIAAGGWFDYGGPMLETTDGGKSWTVLNTGDADAVVGLACPSTGQCLAVGAGGSILTFSGPAIPSPALAITPNNINFPDRPVGQSVSATVTLTNTGAAPLGVAGISSSDPIEFSPDVNCQNTTIAPQGSCQATVRFAPATLGPKAAVLSIAHDGPGSPQQINLTGNGRCATAIQGTATPSGGAAPVRLVAIEVTQAVQDWCNDVPLVEGKQAFVRVYLERTATAVGQYNVGAKLVGSRNGTALPGSPLTPTNYGGTVLAPVRAQGIRQNLDDTLNFELPESWTQGQVVFTLTATSAPVACSDQTSIPSTCAATVTFVPATQPEITVVGVLAQKPGSFAFAAPTIADVFEEVQRLRDVYPTAHVGALLRGMAESCQIGSSSCDFGHQLLTDLETLWQHDGSPNRIYLGLVKDFPADSSHQGAFDLLGSGLARDDGNAAWVLTSSADDEYADPWLPIRNEIAHEVGHTLGLVHAGTANLSGGRSSLCFNEDADPSKQRFGPLPEVATHQSDWTPYPGISGWTYPAMFPFDRAYALGPTGDPETQIWGLDTRAAANQDNQHAVADPSKTFEYMSYCVGLPSIQQQDKWQWTSVNNYQGLLRCLLPERFGAVSGGLSCPYPKLAPAFARPKPPTASTAGSSPYVVVNGSIDPASGAVTLQALTRLDLTTPPVNPAPGAYAAQLLDSSGSVLSQLTFTPETVQRPLTQTTQSGGTSAAFSVLLPDSNAATKLSILNNGQPVASVSAAAHLPQVGNVSPSGAEHLSGPFTIHWTASDADGRPLKALVQFSPDSGVTWQTLAANWPATDLQVQGKQLPGTVSGLIRVQVSDGFSTASAQSGATFSVASSAPTATISSPAPNQGFSGSQLITLSGDAIDVQDGMLPGSSLTWSDSITGTLGTGNSLTVATGDLSVGLHTITLTARNAAGLTGTAAVHIAVGLVAVLPAAMNSAYGGYTTAAYIKNDGAVPANVAVVYFDQAGNLVGGGNTINGLGANGTWTVRQDDGKGFAPGQAGSAVILSSQPVSAFVNEFAPGGSNDGTSYTSVPVGTGTGRTLYAPAIARGAYGGYTTGIGLINLALTTANVTITYRDTNGNPVKTQTLRAIPPGAYRGIYSGNSGSTTDANLADGFAGTATISSNAGQLAAIVNEVGPGGQFSSYDAVPAGNTTLTAPVALNHAYGGYYTAVGLQDVGGTAGTVTISYYDQVGTKVKTVGPLALAANGYLPIYQGDATLGPPPSNDGYTAVLSSTDPVAAIVNEVGPASGAAQQSTAYNTFASGTPTASLPLVESAGPDGWSTGLGIMNTGAIQATVTVTYFDTATGAPIGTPQSKVLAMGAFWGVYQPSAGLPAGTRASAIVTTNGSTVAVICNEQNATSFMSYNGQ